MGRVLTKSELIDRRGDLSPFLIHLTRSGDLKLDREIHSLPQDSVVQISAKASLEARSSFGYFNYKVPMKLGDGRTLNSESHSKAIGSDGVRVGGRTFFVEMKYP